MDFDILGWFNYLLDSIKNIIWNVLVDLVEIVRDLFYWVFDLMLGFGDVMLSWVSSFVSFPSSIALWAGLPPDIVALASNVQLDTALSIIISALVVRFVLNFIPLVG